MRISASLIAEIFGRRLRLIESKQRGYLRRDELVMCWPLKKALRRKSVGQWSRARVDLVISNYLRSHPC